MAEKASGNFQSRWEGKQARLTWQQARERESVCKKTLPLSKPSDLKRIHSLSREQDGGNCPIIQSPPSFNTLRLQFEMRFGWGYTAKPYQ